MNLPDNANDGYINWAQIYEHRNLMLIKLMQEYFTKSWYSPLEEDGTKLEGWFCAGIRTPKGEFKFHLPDDMWDLVKLSRAQRLDVARRSIKNNPYTIIKLLNDWIRADKTQASYQQTYGNERLKDDIFQAAVDAKTRTKPR